MTPLTTACMAGHTGLLLRVFVPLPFPPAGLHRQRLAGCAAARTAHPLPVDARAGGALVPPPRSSATPPPPARQRHPSGPAEVADRAGAPRILLVVAAAAAAARLVGDALAAAARLVWLAAARGGSEALVHALPGQPPGRGVGSCSGDDPHLRSVHAGVAAGARMCEKHGHPAVTRQPTAAGGALWAGNAVEVRERDVEGERPASADAPVVDIRRPGRAGGVL